MLIFKTPNRECEYGCRQPMLQPKVSQIDAEENEQMPCGTKAKQSGLGANVNTTREQQIKRLIGTRGLIYLFAGN